MLGEKAVRKIRLDGKAGFSCLIAAGQSAYTSLFLLNFLWLRDLFNPLSLSAAGWLEERGRGEVKLPWISFSCLQNNLTAPYFFVTTDEKISTTSSKKYFFSNSKNNDKQHWILSEPCFFLQSLNRVDSEHCNLTTDGIESILSIVILQRTESSRFWVM